VDPPRAAHEGSLDVDSERYHNAVVYLIEEAALLGDEHTAFDVGDQHPNGYAFYIFTRRAVKLLEGQPGRPYSPKCSMALAGSPRSHENEPLLRLFSHQGLEEVFSEVR
jgi:hypothetical protein